MIRYLLDLLLGRNKMTYKIINNNPKNYKVEFTIDGTTYTYHNDKTGRYVMKDKQRITYYAKQTRIDDVKATVPDFVQKLLTLPEVDENTFEPEQPNKVRKKAN